jgi:hypothetical protein
MDPIRAIILRDRCMYVCINKLSSRLALRSTKFLNMARFIVPDGADDMLSIAMIRLRETPEEYFGESGMDFEFKALEATLASVSNLLAKEADGIRPRMDKVSTHCALRGA